MKITFDMNVDALYLEFQHLEAGQAETRQLTEEILADYEPDGKLALGNTRCPSCVVTDIGSCDL